MKGLLVLHDGQIAAPAPPFYTRHWKLLAAGVFSIIAVIVAGSTICPKLLPNNSSSPSFKSTSKADPAGTIMSFDSGYNIDVQISDEFVMIGAAWGTLPEYVNQIQQTFRDRMAKGAGLTGYQTFGGADTTGNVGASLNYYKWYGEGYGNQYISKPLAARYEMRGGLYTRPDLFEVVSELIWQAFMRYGMVGNAPVSLEMQGYYVASTGPYIFGMGHSKQNPYYYYDKGPQFSAPFIVEQNALVYAIPKEVTITYSDKAAPAIINEFRINLVDDSYKSVFELNAEARGICSAEGRIGTGIASTVLSALGPFTAFSVGIANLVVENSCNGGSAKIPSAFQGAPYPVYSDYNPRFSNKWLAFMAEKQRILDSQNQQAISKYTGYLNTGFGGFQD